jgi:hypothetical protein
VLFITAVFAGYTLKNKYYLKNDNSCVLYSLVSHRSKRYIYIRSAAKEFAGLNKPTLIFGQSDGDVVEAPVLSGNDDARNETPVPGNLLKLYRV